MDVIEVVMPTESVVSTRPAARGPGAARAEFDLIVATEQASLLGLAYGLTGSRAAAEDLTQEAFLRLHQHWSRVAGHDRPGAWLRRVLLNLATSRARRLATEARMLVRLGRERRPEPVLTSETAEFWSALRDLPRRQSQVLALYYGDDRTVSEVAEILQIAEGTVRAHLHQGRAALKARLDLDDDEEAAA